MRDKNRFGKIKNVAIAATVLATTAGAIHTLYVFEFKKDKRETQEISRIETEWNEAVQRGIEPYEVSGIDRFGPYTLEYLNVDGDEDFDIERLNGRIYRDVSFQVSDIERASR